MPFAANFHTHTWRCDHASGDCLDYAKEAAAAGMRVLGFSDHTPLPDGRWGDMRMALDQIDGYEAAVEAARAAYPQLSIPIGLECEYSDDYQAFYQDEILGRRGYDYLIAGCHFTPLEGRWIPSFGHLTDGRRLAAYAAYVVQTMESGLFAFVTHPDLIGVGLSEWTPEAASCARDICAASAALAVPLEINSYGIRKPWVDGGRGGQRPAYPWDPFWAVAAEQRAKVVLSSDAHRPQDVAAGWDEVAAMRDRHGLVEADLSHLERVTPR
jgi:histidinol-phosphatase (PHP family)